MQTDRKKKRRLGLADRSTETEIKETLLRMPPHFLVEHGLVMVFYSRFKYELAKWEVSPRQKIEATTAAIANLRKAKLPSARAGLHGSLEQEIPVFLDTREGTSASGAMEESMLVGFFADFGYEISMVREVLRDLCETGMLAEQGAGEQRSYRLSGNLEPFWQERMALIAAFDAS